MFFPPIPGGVNQRIYSLCFRPQTRAHTTESRARNEKENASAHTKQDRWFSALSHSTHSRMQSERADSDT